MAIENDRDGFTYIPLKNGAARAIHRKTGTTAIAKDHPVYTMNKDAARAAVVQEIEGAGLAT